MIVKTSGSVTLRLIRLPEKSDDLFRQGYKYRKGTWSKLEMEEDEVDVADLHATGAIKASFHRHGGVLLSHGEYPLGLLMPLLLKRGYVKKEEGIVGIPSKRLQEVVATEYIQNEKKRKEEEYNFIPALRKRKISLRVCSRTTLADEVKSEEYNNLLRSLIPKVASDGRYDWPDPPKMNFF